MVVNISVYNLEDFPDTSKTVSIDLKAVVPVGAYGDEQFVSLIYTSATASGSASIQDVIIRNFTLGWAKSNGISQGPYTINASQNTFRVSINGSAYRTVTLANQTSPVTGEAVSMDMQDKIQGLSSVGGLEAGNLAFKNCQVTFDEGKFEIVSGSPSMTYTGSRKSSVDILSGLTNDVAAHLGLFAPTTSENIAGNAIYQTALSFPYTSSSGLTYVDVSSSTNFQTGDCVGITDGTNIEYRYVSSVSLGLININAVLSNNYSMSSRIQTLRLQDSDARPPSAFESIDDAIRYGISSIVNQIDFS